MTSSSSSPPITDHLPTPPVPSSAEQGRHGKRSTDLGSSTTPSSSSPPSSGRTRGHDPALNPQLSTSSAPPRSTTSGDAKKPYGFEPAQHTPSPSAAPASEYPPLAPRRDRPSSRSMSSRATRLLATLASRSCRTCQRRSARSARAGGPSAAPAQAQARQLTPLERRERDGRSRGTGRGQRNAGGFERQGLPELQ